MSPNDEIDRLHSAPPSSRIPFEVGGHLHLSRPMPLILAALVVSVMGCAANPAGIQAAFVSSEMYAEYSCSTLEGLKADKRAEIDELYKAQKTKRIVDGVSNVLLIPGAASLIEDSSRPLARRKGEFMAILSEYDRRCVGAAPVSTEADSDRADRSSSSSRQRSHVEPSVLSDFNGGGAELSELNVESTKPTARSARAGTHPLQRQMAAIDELASLESAANHGCLVEKTIEAGYGNVIGWYHTGRCCRSAGI